MPLAGQGSPDAPREDQAFGLAQEEGVHRSSRAIGIVLRAGGGTGGSVRRLGERRQQAGGRRAVSAGGVVNVSLAWLPCCPCALPNMRDPAACRGHLGPRKAATAAAAAPYPRAPPLPAAASGPAGPPHPRPSAPAPSSAARAFCWCTKGPRLTCGHSACLWGLQTAISRAGSLQAGPWSLAGFSQKALSDARGSLLGSR